MIDAVKNRRLELMGIGIFLVLLYHLYCFPIVSPMLSAFKYGYIGVDIFLMISGYGLCNSYENHSLKRFYYNRFKRVFPMWWFFLICLMLFQLVLYNITPSVNDVILKALTLTYWTHNPGGSWYVESIVGLYLVFPLMYKACKKYPIAVYCGVSAFSFILLSFHHFSWEYNCFISRIPIFVFGIICYLHPQHINRLLCVSLLFFILSVSYDVSRFFNTAMICPIVLSAVVPNKIKKKNVVIKYYASWENILMNFF